MAESEHDDLADALARMADGDVAPSEHEPGEQPPPQPPAPVSRAVRPAAVKPVTARPIAPVTKPPPAVPAVPKPVRPAAPVLSNTPAPAPPPPAARTVRPIAPAMTSTPGAVRRERPSAPTIRSTTLAPTDAEVDGGQSTGLTAEAAGTEIIDDDDSVIVPAPEASVFIPKSRTTAEAAARIAKKKNLEFRRTLIPILLTCGLLMLGFAVMRFFTGPDSMLTHLPIWIPIVLVAAGLILLALAAVNVLSVKQQLNAEAR